MARKPETGPLLDEGRARTLGGCRADSALRLRGAFPFRNGLRLHRCLRLRQSEILERRFRLVLADLAHRTFRAFGLSGDANIAAVEDEPVMGVQDVFLRHDS